MLTALYKVTLYLKKLMKKLVVHIYTHFFAESIPYDYVIISTGWSCGSTNPFIPLHGYVRGGMTFDPDAGSLKVPVQGIYFVYSQVHINTTNATRNIFAGHQTMICEGEQCRSTVYVMSKALTDVTVGPFYHGGLFNLSANSTISVAAWYDRRIGPSDTIGYRAAFQNTFLGAFLVEEIPPYNATLTEENDSYSTTDENITSTTGSENTTPTRPTHGDGTTVPSPK